MNQLLSLFLKNWMTPLLIDQEINEILKKVTRSELIALLMLKQRGEATMSQLASDMGVQKSTLTNIRQRLTRRGLIQHYRDADDQRIIRLRLTADGEELANRILETINGVLRKIKDVLTPDELEQLIHLLLKVAKVVQTEPVQKEEQSKPLYKRIHIEDE
ncbi:MarR family transcriptional regulator [Laceyella sediminis]|uniref:MarR family transcriptional regulator n=1 Tax=Laceyella sediminis TaxID=573074 RepID=A0ABX5EQ44_9BACL|nr:MarR family transcriptional regulator [Laceyella sediminis]PRZ15396.1 MarR family transcriptional regulator [Laceyella sediminis]